MTCPFLVKHISDGQVQAIAANYAIAGYGFVPLVRRKNFLSCRIEMMLLMRQPPYNAFLAGDLDNRVKTLIDGLRMPTQKSELGPSDVGPTPDENPFYCLLEDDCLIYEFQVRTDQLLAPKRPEQAHRDVVALLEVQIMTAQRSEIVSYFSGFQLVTE